MLFNIFKTHLLSDTWNQQLTTEWLLKKECRFIHIRLEPEKREEEMAAGVSDNAQQPITLSALAGTSAMAPYFKIRFFHSNLGRQECHSLVEGQHNMTNVYDWGTPAKKPRLLLFSRCGNPSMTFRRPRHRKRQTKRIYALVNIIYYWITIFRYGK